MIVEVLYTVSGVAFGLALVLIVRNARDAAQRKAYAEHQARILRTRERLETNGMVNERV